MQPVARIQVVAVEVPAVAVVVPDVEHVGVAVVRMYKAPSVPVALDCSRGGNVFGIEMP